MLVDVVCGVGVPGLEVFEALVECGKVGVGWGGWCGAWLGSSWRWWCFVECGVDLFEGFGGDGRVALEVLEGGFDEGGVVYGSGVGGGHFLVEGVFAFVGGSGEVVAVVCELGECRFEFVAEVGVWCGVGGPRVVEGCGLRWWLLVAVGPALVVGW